METSIIFRYSEASNPEGLYLPGVPLRDLTALDLLGIPEWLLPSLHACPFYTATEKPKARLALKEEKT